MWATEAQKAARKRFEVQDQREKGLEKEEYRFCCNPSVDYYALESIRRCFEGGEKRHVSTTQLRYR
jgi:hypothetical protein